MNNRRLNPYYTIRVKGQEYEREFVILKMKPFNPFYYAHKIHNQIFETPEEVEKAILKKLVYVFDKYKAISGELFTGKMKERRYTRQGEGLE